MFGDPLGACANDVNHMRIGVGAHVLVHGTLKEASRVRHICSSRYETELDNCEYQTRAKLFWSVHDTSVRESLGAEKYCKSL